MVEPVSLLEETVALVATVAIPGVLWAFLYLFAWDHSRVAEASGFGRFTFWLLLGGGAVGSVVSLPFFGFDADILAISLGGGVIPVGLSLYFLRRELGPVGRPLSLFLALFIAQSAALLLTTIGDSLSSSNALNAGFAAAAAIVLIVPPVLLLVSGAGRELFRRTGAALALTDVALVGTYLTTATNPAVGIYSTFPWYLVPPAVTGVLAVLVTRWLLRLPLERAFPLAYSVTTLGVLVGADVLRQPPLYGSTPALFSIGGAGLLDLLYTSGLLALFAAFLLTRIGTFRLAIPRSEGPPGPMPAGPLMLSGNQALVERRFADALRAADEAVAAGLRRTREVAGLPATEGDPQRWKDLPAPAWLVADTSNLRHSAEAPRPEEGPRAMITAGHALGYLAAVRRNYFSPTGHRVGAFLLDLLLLAVPAAGLTAGILWFLPGTALDLFPTPAFQAMILGVTAYGFVYFVLIEYGMGQTLGKAIVGLRVVSGSLQRPSLLQAFQRNVTNLVALSSWGSAIPVTVLIVLRPGPIETTVPLFGLITAVIAVIGILIGVSVPGLFAVIACHADTERRRLGDRWADTRVIPDRRRHPIRETAAPVAPAAGPSG
ncbi:MAG TPA: RDD family protein [Thermoplasmata archaeon]|nr:RDD family protein [Thermoplasmata archaeon]